MAHEPTLPASPAKRLAAKREGHVAKSRQLITAAILLGSTALLQWNSTSMYQEFSRNWERQFQLDIPLASYPEQWTTVGFWLQQASPILQLLAPLACGVLAIAVLTNLLQTGLVFYPAKLAPDVTRLSPANWWKRTASSEHQLESAGSMLRSLGLIALAVTSLWFMREQIAGLALLPASQILTSAIGILTQILIQLGTALFVLGVFDFGWQKLKWERQLRMTPDELRQEQETRKLQPPRSKSTPRHRQDEFRHDLAEAEVLLYVPDGPAVAIAYDEQKMDVPKIQRIWLPGTSAAFYLDDLLQEARKQGIRCLTNTSLTTHIANTLRSRQLVPPHLYHEVIRILRQD